MSVPGLAALKERVPVRTVIVDEVGRIELNDYVPIFHQHAHSLARLVLIGDENEVSPRHQHQMKTLQSVYEVPHLQRYRLNFIVQYRMPGLLGRFLSRNDYAGRRITESWQVCRFVDVGVLPGTGLQTRIIKGKPVTSVHHDAEAAVLAAQRYAKEGLDFKIITKMNGHRDLVAKKLVEAGLSKSLCVTIGSFLGCEVDHVILCPGRTWDAELNDRRTAAQMLSRCKVSMIVCTSRGYLGGYGKDTTLAQLAEECGQRGWISWHDFVAEKWSLKWDMA
ncbi:hypothetical protein PENSPDRAFT_211936 [Peniophora sp. CONT]|nr:hypothetical protein PENSPDRAFT_211936 [Peniophora sp. CONT]